MPDLYQAICDGDVARVQEILRQDRSRATQRSEDGRSLLHEAARWGQPQIPSLLLAYGADVNAADLEGYTPLHVAVMTCDDLRTVRVLLAHGANVNAKAEGGWAITPLQALTDRKCEYPDDSVVDELARLLLSAGAEFCSVAAAAAFGQLEDVQAALNRGASVEDFLYRTSQRPLHIAVAMDNLELVALLIASGAEVNPLDDEGRTPLDLARGPDVMGLLEQHGATTGRQIWSEVYSATQSANEVKFGAYWGTKLLEAARDGNISEIKRIMALPLEVGGLKLLRLTASDADGNGALHLAAAHGHLEAVELLAREGWSVGGTNSAGLTAEDLARQRGHDHVVAYLGSRARG